MSIYACKLCNRIVWFLEVVVSNRADRRPIFANHDKKHQFNNSKNDERTRYFILPNT